jgi:hypothetical protein
MDIGSLHTVDTKMRLLAGMPIEVPDVCEIQPYTLKEIAQVGYSVYAQKLNTLTMDVKKILGDRPELRDVELSAFDLYTHVADEDFREAFESALKFFLREDKLVCTRHDVDGGNEISIIVLGVDDINEITDEMKPRIIHRKNFHYIVEVLKLQNGLSSIGSSDEYNAQNDKAKRIIEKLKKAKAKIQEIKSNKGGGGNDLDIVDLISAVASKSNSVNALTVWDMTLYQLYDHFKRLQLINQYDINIMALMNGAKDIELQHWSERLD